MAFLGSEEELRRILNKSHYGVQVRPRSGLERCEFEAVGVGCPVGGHRGTGWVETGWASDWHRGAGVHMNGRSEQALDRCELVKVVVGQTERSTRYSGADPENRTHQTRGTSEHQPKSGQTRASERVSRRWRPTNVPRRRTS